MWCALCADLWGAVIVVREPGPNAAATPAAIVRRASIADLAEASDIFAGYLAFYRVSHSPQAVRAYLAARIERGQSLLWLAVPARERPAGLAQVYWTFSSLALAEIWVLNDLFVLPHARRRGLARALIRACLRDARAAGVATVELTTMRGNTAAQSLYEAEGFARDAMFVNYKHNLDGMERDDNR